MIGYVVTWDTVSRPGHGIITQAYGKNYYWAETNPITHSGIKIHAGSFKTIRRPPGQLLDNGVPKDA